MRATPSEMMTWERQLLGRGEIVVGLDEVGRGALAGPMTVGAVVLTGPTDPPAGLNDSKLLTATRREALVAPLQDWAASWSLGSVSAAEIDAWGLRLALAVAATRALEGLAVTPTHALIDGPVNLLRAAAPARLGAVAPPSLRFATLAATTLVKGDRRSAVIAAASVLAKVARDAQMVSLDQRCGDYHWASNKGYGSREHLAALRQRGPHDEHRQSWRLPDRAAS